MEIELPDGTILDAPDGSDPRTIVARYKDSLTRTAAKQTLADSTPYQKFGVGVARPIVEMGLGLKDLASKGPVNLDVDTSGNLIGTEGTSEGLSDEDRATLERMSQVTGGAATAGRIAGEGAMLLAPGGIVGKLGSALPRAMARYAIPLADVAANAGTEALKAPSDEESRSEHAKEGALGSVGGQAVGKVLKLAIAGAKPYATAIASRFMDDGIPLTPGQALGGGAQTIEQNLAKLPIVGPAIKARQNEALSAWNLKMLADTANSVDTGGTGDLVNAAGPKGFQQAAKIFKDAYDFHWDRPMNLDTQSLGSSWGQLATDAQSSLGPEAGAIVQRKLASTFDEIKSIANPKSGTVNGSQLQDIDQGLGQAARDAAKAGNGDVSQALSQAKQSLRDEYPENFRVSLDALDSKYAEFARLTRAGTAINGPAAGQPFTPANLLSAARALDRSVGKRATAQGTALMQPQAVDAMSVFPRPSVTPLLMTEKLSSLPIGIASRPLYSKFGNNLIMGRTSGQEAVQKILKSDNVQALTDAINEYLRSAQVGAAVGSD